EAGEVVARLRAANPGMTILARAHSNAEVKHLLSRGADGAVLAEKELAHSMAEMALSAPPYRLPRKPAHDGKSPPDDDAPPGARTQHGRRDAPAVPWRRGCRTGREGAGPFHGRDGPVGAALPAAAQARARRQVAAGRRRAAERADAGRRLSRHGRPHRHRAR